MVDLVDETPKTGRFNNKRGYSSRSGGRGSTDRRKANRDADNNRRPPKKRFRSDFLEADEELDSDEEDKAVERGRQLDKSNVKQTAPAAAGSDTEEPDGFFESLEDQRAKLAKSFLERLGMGVKKDEIVADLLTSELKKSGKKVFLRVAENVGVPHWCVALGADVDFGSGLEWEVC